MKNDISQSLGLHLDNINVYAKVYQNIPLSSRDKAIFTCSEFGARQSLDRWWMSFCNSLIFFRIWTSAKTQPISNVIWQSLGVHLVNINVYAKFHHNIPLSSRDSTIITFFRIWSWAKPRPMKNVISQSFGLDLVNINVYATVYQNIPLSLRDRPFSLFHNLALGKASADDECHFAIVSLFSEFEPRQKLSQSQMSFDNLMGYTLSISTCMQNSITIFHSVQEIAPLSLFQNLALVKASTDDKCHFAIPWARSCQYQCVCKILSKYSKRFKS